MLFHLIS
jgi:protein gp37